MIKLISAEKIKGTYDNKKIDWDRYDFEISSPVATKEYSIVVDFLDKELTGDCIKYGGWYDLEKEECIEFLELLIAQKIEIKRDFTSILALEKKNINK